MTTSMQAAASRLPLKQSDYKAKLNKDSKINSNDVATLPRPGTSTLSSIHFHDTSTSDSNDVNDNNNLWVTYLSPTTTTADDGTTKMPSLSRQLVATNVKTGETKDIFQPGNLGKEDDYSLEEKLRRERLREMSTGVTSYSWSKAKSSKKMLIPLGGTLWLLDDPLGSSSEPRKLVETNTEAIDDDDFDALPTNAPLLDAKISADGSTVAFVAQNEVYVVSTEEEKNKPKRITSGARGVTGMSNGVADYVAQEELERTDGFWISPKGTKVVYENVDESHIPSYRITHQGEEKGLSSTLLDSKDKDNADQRIIKSQEDIAHASTVTYEEHRYPFAGARNPVVKLGVVDTTGGDGDTDVTWFDIDKVFGHDFYLAKVEWLSSPNDDDDNDDTADDSTKLIVQLLDRKQQTIALVLLDCETGSMTTLHVEKAIDGGWINLNNAFRPLPSDSSSSYSFRFLWASERDGYRHLYVLEASLENSGEANMIHGASVIRRLTGPGEFVVEEVLDIGKNDDDENQYVYYMGTSPNKWLERHLFRVPLKNGAGDDDGDNSSSSPECLTDSIPGQHSCVVNVKSGLFVDTVSSIDNPPTVTVHKLPPLGGGKLDQAASLQVLHKATDGDSRVEQLKDALKPPTFHQFPSTDGKVTLQAAVYLPDEEMHGKGPYPLVVATYGGPHVQYVQNTWSMITVDLRSQFLRANGFAVIKVDNRGSNRRGLVFETPIYGNMGDVELADQVAGVNFAVEQGIADKQRVAVSGWSYGGYMALKCLTHYPNVFHAAISGAPVTDWTLYDTAYTERYMGLPQENSKGYAKASALAKVADMEGSLLLCHGLLDENVLFRQSAVLVNELIKHQKAYEIALFPNERHGPRRQQDRAFLEERILAFLQRSLGLV